MDSNGDDSDHYFIYFSIHSYSIYSKFNRLSTSMCLLVSVCLTMAHEHIFIDKTKTIRHKRQTNKSVSFAGVNAFVCHFVFRKHRVVPTTSEQSELCIVSSSSLIVVAVRRRSSPLVVVIVVDDVIRPLIAHINQIQQTSANCRKHNIFFCTKHLQMNASSSSICNESDKR